MEKFLFLDKKYIFNMNYKIRSDINRLIITNNNSRYVSQLDIETPLFHKSFAWFMHPSIALIFNYFTGEYSLHKVICNIVNDLNLSEEKVKELLASCIENTDTVYYPVLILNTSLALPKNVIVENTENLVRKDILRDIDIDNITDNFNISERRFNIPNEMTLMTNSNCYTRCVYCYADKQHVIERHLSIERMKEIVKEAYDLGLRECQINGGDFFCYRHWEELLTCLHLHSYQPYISTKVPINEDTILKLKDLGYRKIQISLDSICIQTLKKMLNVGPDYFDKMNKTLHLLNKHGMLFCVKSVITRFNDSLETVKALINYLSQFENIEYHTIAPGEYSLYSNFNGFRTTKSNFDAIRQMVTDMHDSKINAQEYEQPISANQTFENKVSNFKNRSACSGNQSGFLVLPDGKVTICEQTYWLPQFILGDMNTQSIMEMWNSREALALWNFSQDEIQEKSPCKHCAQFSNCRKGRGVCWRMVYTHFGVENFDFPAPQCPYAPPTTKDIFIS